MTTSWQRRQYDLTMNLLTRLLTRMQNRVAWIIAIASFVVLGLLRRTTDAEYAFASVAIVPVFLVAWTGGRVQGFVASALAVLMWVCSEVLSEHDFAETWVPYLNGFSRLATYCLVVHLTVRTRELLAKQVEMATHDPLTNLLNRRAFLEIGSAESNRARRYGHPLTVVFLDLDNFKNLNDTRGHEIGDAALVAVATAMNDSLRRTDTAARLGGDEFAVILPEIDQYAVREACEKLSSTIHHALDAFLPVRVSVGVAWFAHPPQDFSKMLAVADALMYRVKGEGQHGILVQLFDGSHKDRSS
jgi:diguanylate cyclase (GGDEF)-like protein